jgi:hypothetical protein
MRPIALLSLVWVNAAAQPVPLRNISKPRPPREISILSVKIQDLKPAHGGPSYFSVERAPFRGKQEIVEVSLFGQEAIGAVSFELIDEAGRVIAAVPAMRTGDAIDAGEYILKIDVPQIPFRFHIRGRDVQGQPFERTFRRLFVPMEGAPAAPIPAEFDERFQAGEIRMGRSGVGDAAYEPLISPNGNPIGLRVRFNARFDTAGYYDLTPHVFPVYENFRWRGTIGMSATSTGIARYEANKDYPLTFDFVPGYVLHLAGGTCLSIPASGLAVWEAIMASTQPVKYRVDISSVDFVSETAPLPPQRVWFEGLRRDGVADCGQR